MKILINNLVNFKAKSCLALLLLIFVFSVASGQEIDYKPTQEENEFNRNWATLIQDHMRNLDSTKLAINQKLVEYETKPNPKKEILYTLLKCFMYANRNHIPRFQIQKFKIHRLLKQKKYAYLRELVDAFENNILVDRYPEKYDLKDILKLVAKAKKHENIHALAYLYTTIGINYCFSDKYNPLAKDCLLKSIKLYSKLNDSVSIHMSNYYLAYAYEAAGQMDSTLAIAQRCADYYKKQGINQYVTRSQFTLVGCYSQLGQFQNAKAILFQIKSNPKLSKSHELLLNDYLSWIYGQMDQIDSSRFYLKKCVPLKLALESKEKLDLASDIEDGFQKEAREKAIRQKQLEFNWIKKNTIYIFSF